MGRLIYNKGSAWDANKKWRTIYNTNLNDFIFSWAFIDVNIFYSDVSQELDKIVEYELKMGGVLLHPTFSGGKEKDK